MQNTCNKTNRTIVLFKFPIITHMYRFSENLTYIKQGTYLLHTKHWVLSTNALNYSVYNS